jgi:hypothetical protein
MFNASWSDFAVPFDRSRASGSSARWRPWLSSLWRSCRFSGRASGRMRVPAWFCWPRVSNAQNVALATVLPIETFILVARASLGDRPLLADPPPPAPELTIAAFRVSSRPADSRSRTGEKGTVRKPLFGLMLLIVAAPAFATIFSTAKGVVQSRWHRTPGPSYTCNSSLRAYVKP